ncbi:uncharacterized protein LOC144132488 isoform X1 [Amblyomma americanum]
MSISQEEIDRQERELRSQLESALRKHGYYSPEEIDEVMKTFKYFGLKAIDQLKHISKEQLIEKGIPTVTATILKEEFSGADAGNKKYTGDAKTFWTKMKNFGKECLATSVADFTQKLLQEFVKEIVPVVFKVKVKSLA